MTTAKSAFPVPVDELLPQARRLADELGQTPSRNRLMSELKIGAPKAKALLEDLHQDQSADTTEPTSARLHLVENTTHAEHVEPGSSDEPADSDPVIIGDTPEEDTAREVAASEPMDTVADPDVSAAGKQVRAWPVLLLALPAFVAIWSGWVGLGGLTGFGIVHPLPGIWDALELNTAITLPIGVETYAAYALRVWLSGQVPELARRFAMVSALGSLVLGALGQVAYHLMTAAGMTQAPWWITTLVACLPVAVLGMGAALTHLIHTPDTGRPEVTR